MAVIFEAAYSKKLGLPNYSSHSYVASVRVEVQDISQVPEESRKLYRMLQDAVDTEIAVVGFLPDAAKYGANGNQRENGARVQRYNPNAGISEKQLDLINRVVRENNANKAEIDALCVEMFGGGVRTLNRMQASNFIDALFEKYPRRNGNGQRSRFQRQEAPASS